MMSESLLYRLHSHGNNGVTADTNRFEDVFASRFRKVRIFRVKGVDKESKEWVGSPPLQLQFYFLRTVRTWAQLVAFTFLPFSWVGLADSFRGTHFLLPGCLFIVFRSSIARR
jgi:hypothetical protein